MKKKLMTFVLLIICTVATVAPFLWMILTSFKSYEESIRIPPTILPEVFTVQSYLKVLDKFPFASFYINTILVMALTVVVQLVICTMAAYAFARLDFPGRDVLFLILLALLMIPGQIFLVPNYEIMVKLNLADTITALWFPKVFTAFGTFMLREFFKGLPRSLDEAAMLDGCSYFNIYLRVLLPLLKPALASLAILTAISTFKDLMWPLIVNNSMDKMTLSAGLAMLIGEHTTYYPQIMAGGMLAVLPMIIFFFVFQKQFVEGIATTGVKQ
ncbi:MAG: carbohydrate ABC transporter permease [Lachnospiraceae bacterium]